MNLAIAKKQDSDFDQFWRLYPKRPGANRIESEKQWVKRIKEGDLPQEILDGTKMYRAYCEALKIEPQYIKQAATFLGPKKHFQCDWTVTERKNQRQDWADKLTGKTGGDDGFTIDI